MIPIKDNAHLLTLANQRYLWPGCHEIVFLCENGVELCSKCVKNHFKVVISARSDSDTYAWSVCGYITEIASSKCDCCGHTFNTPQVTDFEEHNGDPVPAFNVTLHDKLWTVVCVNNGNAFSGYDLRYTMKRALESMGLAPTGAELRINEVPHDNT